MSLRFLHLTDIHLSHPDVNDQTLDTDTLTTLHRVLCLIDKIDPAPEFIVASGDLTNQGHVESYELLAEMMAVLPMPVFYALGNHDKRAGFRAAFPGYAGGADDPLDHATVIGGAHLIALDCSVPGRTGGLDDAQFAFLYAALSRHTELPKILAIHHPPKLTPGGESDWTTLAAADSARLGERLKDENVIAILSGHVHHNRVALWHGSPLVITNGLNGSVDILAKDEVRVVDGTGMAICDLLPGGLSVTFLPTEDRPPLRVIPRDRLRNLA